MPSKQSPYQFDLTAGQLALNLANTVSRRQDPERRKDHLGNYSNLLEFARQSQIISAKQEKELRARAGREAEKARHSFGQAIRLREGIYKVFSAVAQRNSAPASDLGTINEFAVQALRHRILKCNNGGYRWEWRADAKNPLDRLLWPIAQAAADLLTSDELPLVRMCEAGDCEWLFLDRSRNRSRRWCDMNSCGNREKARRHYRRTNAG